MTDRREDARELLNLLVATAELLLESLERPLEQLRIGVRRHREALLVVRDRKPTLRLGRRSILVFDA